MILSHAKMFPSKLPLICWFEVCSRENGTGIIKRSLFKPEEKKNRVWGLNPGSRVFILAAVKTLTAFTMQANADVVTVALTLLNIFPVSLFLKT